MLPFKRILFPIDFSDPSFSEHSIGAARYVEAFTGRFDADLTLLHVIGPPQYNDILLRSREEEREHLERYLADEFEYFRVERVLVEGDPAAKILETARSHGSDLIMMPTHGAGRFRRFLLGSVTAKVLHDADCPVWTGVHLENAPPLEKIEFRKLLCAVNRGEHAKVVLGAASELAEEYRAELAVVHVAGSPDRAEDVKALVRQKAPGAELRIERGEIPITVACAAARMGADLLVIGRSPSPGVAGRLREHAYPIIRQSPCPVISV